MQRNVLNINSDNNNNFLIISKPGAQSTKHCRNYITFKKGDLSLKINLNNQPEKKLNQEIIFQTLTDFQKNFIEKEIQKFSSKNKLQNLSKIIKNQNSQNESTKKNINEVINLENLEETNFNNKKEFSSIIISDDKKLSDNIKENEKENLKEIEKNFASSINKKSIRTQLNKKDIQKSIQQSDKAEISKMNSESDNVTEFDNKTKIFKFRYENVPSIKREINEKEELENELINDNTEMKNNNDEKIIFKQDTITLKKNNFIDEDKKENNVNNKDINNNLIDKNKNKKNEDNVINLIDGSKDNKISIDGSIADENKNKQKISIPLIIPQSIFKKNNPGENNKKNKKVKTKPVTIIKTKIINNINNSIPISSNRNPLINNNSYLSKSVLQFTQQNCYICEKPFYLAKLFCPECGIHFLCRKCIKNYYEEIIENKNNLKVLKCPNASCGKNIDYDLVKMIISEIHQKIYESNLNENEPLNERYLISSSISKKHKDDKNNVKLYSEKHVLDISNNMNFFMYKKSKDIFCPKCLNPELFSKTNNQFIKCLNCNYKICKYCLKEFTFRHLDIKAEGYCKVYFRRDDEFVNNNNCIYNFFMQLLFVVVMYFFTYSGTYLFFYNMFKEKFQLNNKNKNIKYWIKKFIIIIISFLFLIISFPFIIVCFPFFPAIIAICDY